MADYVIQLDGGVVLHQPGAELRCELECRLKIRFVRQIVLTDLYLYVRRTVIVAAFRAVPAVPTAHSPGQDFRRADYSVLVFSDKCVTAYLCRCPLATYRHGDVPVRSVWVLAANIRRVHIAPEVRIIRAGAVYDYSRGTAGRHFAVCLIAKVINSVSRKCDWCAH